MDEITARGSDLIANEWLHVIVLFGQGNHSRDGHSQARPLRVYVYGPFNGQGGGEENTE